MVRVARAFSTPPAATLGHLQHPLRSDRPPAPPDAFPELHAFSLELADSLELALHTLLLVSPPQMLDPAREQFAACFLSVPTPSVAALLTLIKSLNYMAANLVALVSSRPLSAPRRNAFDLGELLQSVGDALGGIAAQAAVDIVLFHGDVGLRHVTATGDECGLMYALSHIIRQLLHVACPADAIELGLLSKSPSRSHSDHHEPPRITFSITHRLLGAAREPVSRDLPRLDSPIFRHLLTTIGAAIHISRTQPVGTDRQYLLDVLFESAPHRSDSEPLLPAHDSAARQPYADIQVAREPSLQELNSFARSLKGRKVTFHASSSGPFAKCLSENLTAWGMDVQHIAIDSRKTNRLGEPAAEESGYGSHEASDLGPPGPGHNEDIVDKVHQDEELPTFILIDDDINILRSRILQLRKGPQYNLQVPARKRPPLVHRPKSSPYIRPPGIPLVDNATRSLPEHDVSIVHFTSLANYKPVRDLIQTVSEQSIQSAQIMPEIIAIPKPSGPRRFLTALYTAVSKPLVDPLFAPIATSPPSPSSGSLDIYNTFSTGRQASLPSTSKPITPPDSRPQLLISRPSRSPRECGNAGHILPPSPLGVEVETAEYFPQSLPSPRRQTPSSGMIIQSPDGQSAGVYFQPPSRSVRPHPSGSRPMKREAPASAEESPYQHQAIETSSSRVRSLPPFLLATNHTSRLSPMSMPLANATVQQAPDKDPPLVRQAAAQADSKPTLASLEADARPVLTNDIRMPLSKAPKSATLSSFRKHSPLQKKNKGENSIVPPINVLIVEDNPINQTILQTFMRRNKIKYDTATNGQQALDKYKSGTFHLILMDIQMPVMNGIEATKEIRRLEAESNVMPLTPNTELLQSTSEKCSKQSLEARTLSDSTFRSSVIIVALTASSLQSDRVNALAAGCNDFLTKPVSLIWLNNKIMEWGSLKALQMYANSTSQFFMEVEKNHGANAGTFVGKLKAPLPEGLPRNQKDDAPGQHQSAKVSL